MTFEIRRIPVGPVAKISFVLYFIISLIMILLYTTFVMGIVGSMMGTLLQDFDLPGANMISGPIVIISGLFGAFFMSIIYTVITIILVLIYNAVCSFTSGIAVEIKSPDMDTVDARMVAFEREIGEIKSQQKALKENQLDKEQDQPGNYSDMA